MWTEEKCIEACNTIVFLFISSKWNTIAFSLVCSVHDIYMVPHTVGSIVSIFDRLCVDTQLFSLFRSLCLLQRRHPLTHPSNDCNRVSQWLFRNNEVFAVSMDGPMRIYMSMTLYVFLLYDLEFHQKNFDRSKKSASGNPIALNTL